MAENPTVRMLLDRYKSRLGGNAQPVDEWDQEFQRQQAEDARPLLDAGHPDEEAAARRVSDRTGLPSNVVKPDLPQYQKLEAVEKFRAALSGSTAMTDWGRKYGPVALDDHRALNGMSRSWDGMTAARRNAIQSYLSEDNGFFDRMYKKGLQGLAATRAGVFGTTAALWEGVISPVTKFINPSESQAEFVDRVGQGLRTTERAERAISEMSVAGETRWQDVPTVGQLARNPARFKDVIGFMADSTAQSIPGTAFAVSNPIGAGMSNTGNVADTRARNNGRLQSNLKDLALAAPAGAASAFLDKFGFESIVGAAGKNALTRFGKAAGGEALTEFSQGVIENAGGTQYTDKGFSFTAALDEGLQGALGSLGMSAGMRGPQEAFIKMAQVRDARVATAAIESLAEASANSKTRTRDPAAFAELVQAMGDERGVSEVYIPAEKVVEFFQSYNPDDDFDPFNPGASMVNIWLKQAQDALPSKGDVVIPVGDVMAHMVGTPAFEALKADMRLSAGGLSMAESEAYETEQALVQQDMEAQADADAKAAAETQAPHEKLFESVAAKLHGAGFRLDAANTQALLMTERAATRAERLGRELTGAEYDNLTIEQVLPPALAAMQPRDVQLDPVSWLRPTIKAMRSKRGPRSEGTRKGTSLVQFLRAAGGIDDLGGDLASMGLGQLGTFAGKGQSKLIRKTRDQILAEGGPSLLGANDRSNTNTLDALTLAAWEHGYFPDFGERPDTNALLEAIAQEVAGNPVYAIANDNTTDADSRAMAADELRTLLMQEGLDPETASDADILGAVTRYQQEREGGGRSYDQELPDTLDIDGVQRPTRNSNGQSVARTAEGVRNFWAWFGDSKVVDDQGRPLVVYHGTNADFEAFKTDGRWKTEGAGAFFTDDPAVASTYVAPQPGADAATPQVIPVYLSLQNMPEVDFEGKNWNSGPMFYLVRDTKTFEDLDTGFFESRDEAERAAQDEGLDEYEVVEYPLRLDEDGFLDVDWENLDAQGTTTDGLAIDARTGGFDGLKVSNVRDHGGRQVADDKAGASNIYVAMEPTQIKSVNNVGSFDPADARILYQEFNEGPRGRVQFDNGKTTIELFKARNLSTMLHELGHTWLEELKADAALDVAPDQLRADWKAVTDWFASNGHPVGKDGTIPVDAHELWARGVERFLMEGKAPSSALRRAFQTFRTWMLRIYGIVDALRSPITPEIREVMQRLIATDEQIAEAAQEQEIAALFDSAAAAGMTETEFTSYRKSVDAARDEAYDGLLYKVMEAVRRRRTAEYRDARAPVAAVVSEAVDKRPVFRAVKLLRGAKMERAWFIDRYGEDAVAQLPHGSVSKTGMDAGILAEMSGFQTADEMIMALFGYQDRRKSLIDLGDKRSVRQATIDDEVQAIMDERYGDVLDDGSIEEEALAAVHSERQGDVLAAELRQLGKQSGGRPSAYRVAKEWARERIAGGKVSEHVSKSAIQRYARAAAKSAKEAQAAMIAGDMKAAFIAKQSQMLNNALVAEAKRVSDEIDKAVRRMAKLASKRTIASVDQDYLEQIHALLEQVDLKQRTGTDIERLTSFEEWARAQDAAGHDVIVPPSFAERLGTRHWSQLTVEEMLGLYDTVRQIEHLGRFKQKLIDAKEERDFNAVIGEAVEAAGKLPPKPPASFVDPGFLGRAKARVADFDASLLRMETVFDWLDGGDANGIFNRAVFRPLADAQNRAKAMTADYVTRLTDLLKAIPKADIKRWSEIVVTPELIDPRTGMPSTFSRDQLVAMALNVGNAGNLQRLLDGYGWNEAAVMAVLNRELTAADWQYVQNVWDVIDTLWPEIAALERRVNGVEPEKVEAVPVDTPHGMLKGGYYPAVYDPSRSMSVEADAAKSSALFDATYTKATTRASSTKDRAAQVKRPIWLSLGIINNHVTEVIHDITHREAVMQADRILTNPRVATVIDNTLGPEIRRMFRPWLQHIANEQAMDKRGLAAWEGFAKKLRTNTSIVGMGFRLSTIMMQVAGYSNSFEKVGATWVASAMKQTASHPVETFNFVMERSGEVRNRMDTMERDINENVRSLAGRTDVIAMSRKFAFHGIGYMDRVVVIPTWIGAYNKALANGADEMDAIYEADKAVRQSQGAGGAKDLAALQRSNEWMRLATMFYSYQSAVYQRFRTLGRDMRAMNAGDVPGLAARAFWLVAVPPLLSELLAGRGPEEEEDWGLWAFQKMLLSLIGPIPIARDAANALTSKFGYTFTPAARAIETSLDLVKDIRRSIEGDDTKRMTRNALETAGYTIGLPTGQLAQSVQFLVDVNEGEQTPETVGDWWEGLSKGKMKE